MSWIDVRCRDNNIEEEARWLIRKALEIESMNWHKPHTIAATGGANGSGARARALGATPTPTAPCFQFLTTILDGFHSLAIRNKPGAADLCTHMYEAQIAVYLVQDYILTFRGKSLVLLQVCRQSPGGFFYGGSELPSWLAIRMILCCDVRYMVPHAHKNHPNNHSSIGSIALKVYI